MKKKNVKKELIKARKFKNSTPGQDRDFETLDANRMFKAYEDVEIDESWKKVKPTDRVQRLHQLSISGWLSKQMGRKGDPHRFNHKVPSIYFDDVDLVVDDKTVVKGALKGNATMADLLKKVQAHAKKKRLRWESVEIDEKTVDWKKDDKEHHRQEFGPGRKHGGVSGKFGSPGTFNMTSRQGVGAAAHRKARSVKKVRGAKEEVEMEDAPTTSTAGVANWNPLLGGKRPRVVYKKRRNVDGRTKDYKETVTRLQARRDASAARELEQKLNMFGVQSNPFREETQMENKKYLTTKEGSIEDAVLHSVKTETPVNPNDARPTLHLPKKYLESKKDSLESAVADVMVTETISGNMQRDLMRLDRHQFIAKYRMSKSAAQSAGGGIQKYGRKGKTPDADITREEVEDEFDYKPKKGAIAAPGSGSIAKAKKAKSSDVNKSIEQQMADARKEEVEIDEAKPTSKQVKMAKGIAWDKRHRGGDMTGAWKKAEKIKKGLGDHPTVQKALRRANEETDPNDDRGVGSQAYTDYIRSLTPGETAVKDPEAAKASSASKQASAEKKRQVTKIDDAVDPEVAAARANYKKGNQDMKKQHILDVAKIKASKVGEEVIVGLLDMGIIQVNENTETGFEVINDPVANRENLLRMAYNTGAKILDEKINKGKISSDAYDHATALYKDQWKDRKIADYDKEHGKDSRAKEMRKDAEVDRKRMWAMTGDKWKHAKDASGEEKGKKNVVGNKTPDPKDSYKKEDYHEQLMGEAGKWIQKAIKKPGALHRDLGVPEDEKIPKSKIKAAAKEGGKVGQRARLAITLGKMNK